MKTPSSRPKRRRRAIHVAGQETAAERQTRTAVSFIMKNQHYQAILRLLRQGLPNSVIAEWGITKGVFDANQKTVVGYLQYFRKAKAQLCKPIATDDNKDENGLPSYDHLIDANLTLVHEETELVRLIGLQKARIGLAFSNERQLNMLMSSNRREVEELRNLLMDLAKLRGLWGNTMDINFTGYSDSVKDDLKGIQQDEGQRNVIATLVADLATVGA